MFGISLTEGLLVCLVILLVFGPEKLPEFASKIGKLVGGFRKTSDRYRREFYNSFYAPAEDFKNRLNTETKNLSEAPGDSLNKISEEVKQDLKKSSND